MVENKNNYCLILAGGKGRRLWPCSREERPKQFLDFFSTGKTLLQQTYERMAGFIPPENIYVSTNRIYADIVEEQLPELPKLNILSEPIFRNTAPSLAWATYRIIHINPSARLVVVPSDQAVFNEEEFRRNITEGLDFVSSNNCMLTMGVKPTRPEPGYGYIQIGDAADKEGVYKVKSFTEKPDRRRCCVTSRKTRTNLMTSRMNWNISGRISPHIPTCRLTTEYLKKTRMYV